MNSCLLHPDTIITTLYDSHFNWYLISKVHFKLNCDFKDVSQTFPSIDVTSCLGTGG